jgi:hypothetical protein
MGLDAARTRFGFVTRPRAILAVVVLVELFLFADYHQERWRKGLLPLGRPQALAGEGLVIRCDGLGYYAWLRSLLIDGDWSFDNEFDDHNVLGDFVPPPDCRTDTGRRANLWSAGPACVWAIVVVPGHFLISVLDLPWPADGYSLPYQLLVGAATLLASFSGLGLLYGICRRVAEPIHAALAAAFLTLGTTILYYSAIEVSMAHGVATAIVAGLVCYWLRTYESSRWRRWFLVGLLVGLATLMRWQLITFAVLPAGECLLAGVRSRPARWPRLVLAALGAVLGFLPQLIAWRNVYGSWIVTPFPTAHNWTDPAWWQVLASPDRGLLYWTPLVVLPGFGYLSLFLRHRQPQRDRTPLQLLTIAFVLQLYLLASLWGDRLYLGAAFGFRHLTESLVALAPGLALLFTQASARHRRCLCVLGCLLVLWNLLLISQYRYGWIAADQGAAPNTLIANVFHLVRRKRFLLVGQTLMGPLLLGVIYFCPTPGRIGYRLSVPTGGLRSVTVPD